MQRGVLGELQLQPSRPPKKGSASLASNTKPNPNPHKQKPSELGSDLASSRSLQRNSRRPTIALLFATIDGRSQATLAYCYHQERPSCAFKA